MFFFFFKQKTAYEMRISDWSSDVCSSDLVGDVVADAEVLHRRQTDGGEGLVQLVQADLVLGQAGALEGVLDGPARLGQQRRVGTGDLAVADDLADRRDAQTLGLGLGNQDRKGVVLGKRGIVRDKRGGC